jgi:hypothetical protein
MSRYFIYLIATAIFHASLAFAGTAITINTPGQNALNMARNTADHLIPLKDAPVAPPSPTASTQGIAPEKVTLSALQQKIINAIIADSTEVELPTRFTNVMGLTKPGSPPLRLKQYLKYLKSSDMLVGISQLPGNRGYLFFQKKDSEGLEQYIYIDGEFNPKSAFFGHIGKDDSDVRQISNLDQIANYNLALWKFAADLFAKQQQQASNP